MRMKKCIKKENYLLSAIGGKGMLEILTDKSSKYYKKRNLKQNCLKKYKYSKMKRFHRDLLFKVYICYFIYNDGDKISEED